MSFVNFGALREYVVANLKPKAAYAEFKGLSQKALLGAIDLVTGGTVIPDFQTITYGVNTTLTTSQRWTTAVCTLTGATTLTIPTDAPNKGDIALVEFTATGSTRVVTFDGLVIRSTGTLSVTISSPSIIMFMYDGDYWTELFRTDSRATEKATTVAYAGTIAITPAAAHLNYLNVAQLTGAATINITTTNLVVNDRVIFTFSADVSNRTVTFGTGIKSAGTLTVTASKSATASFIYDGTSLVELSRAVTV